MPDRFHFSEEDDDEQQSKRLSQDSGNQNTGEFGMDSGAQRMPRKAIPRKSGSMPVFGPETYESPNPLDEQSFGEDGSSSSYDPSQMPSRPVSRQSRAKLRQAEAPNSKGSDVGGLQEVLFQVVSMLPGMRGRMEGGPSKSLDDGSHSGTAAGRPGGSAPPQAIPEPDRRGPSRPVARGIRAPEKQSSMELFMEKVQGMLLSGGNDINTVQEVEAPETKRKKTVINFGIIIGCIVIFCLAYNFIPRKPAAADVFTSMPHEFHSAEQDRSFTIVDPGTCDVAIGPDTLKTQLKFFLGDWRDVTDVLIATPFQKQFWLFKTDSGVKDSSGSELYQKDSAESELSAQAVKVAEAVTAYYAKEKAYPTKIDDLPSLTYTNPFTKKEESPELREYSDGSKKSGEDVDRKKIELYNGLVFATSPLEKDCKPGSIICWNVKLISAQQTLKLFVIKPFGKNGAPIAGGHLGTKYMIAMEEGKPKDLLSAKPLSDWVGKAQMRPVTVLLFKDPIDSNLVFLLRHCAKIVFTILAFGSLGFVIGGSKGLSQIMWVLVLIATGIPAILCVFSAWLP